jgi:hypothetical protein
MRAIPRKNDSPDFTLMPEAMTLVGEGPYPIIRDLVGHIVGILHATQVNISRAARLQASRKFIETRLNSDTLGTFYV